MGAKEEQLAKTQDIIADDSFIYMGNSFPIMDVVNAIKAGYRLNRSDGETKEVKESDDYITRFITEYKQLTTRIKEHNKYVVSYKPKLNKLELYLEEKRLEKMLAYKKALELIASYDGIDLDNLD